MPAGGVSAPVLAAVVLVPPVPVLVPVSVDVEPALSALVELELELSPVCEATMPPDAIAKLVVFASRGHTHG